MSKLNKFLICIIILNLFASIFIIFGKEKDEKLSQFKIKNFNEFASTYMAGPSANRYNAFIQSLIEKRFEELYNETKGLDEINIKRYYEENNKKNEDILISNIQTKYGVSDYDTFVKLVEKIREIYKKQAKYKQCNIVKNSCKMNEDYTTSEIIIQYTKFQKIKLTVEMSNVVKTDVQMFKIQVKEEK